MQILRNYDSNINFGFTLFRFLCGGFSSVHLIIIVNPRVVKEGEGIHPHII